MFAENTCRAFPYNLVCDSYGENFLKRTLPEDFEVSVLCAIATIRLQPKTIAVAESYYRDGVSLSEIAKIHQTSIQEVEEELKIMCKGLQNPWCVEYITHGIGFLLRNKESEGYNEGYLVGRGDVEACYRQENAAKIAREESKTLNAGPGLGKQESKEDLADNSTESHRMMPKDVFYDAPVVMVDGVAYSQNALSFSIEYVRVPQKIRKILIDSEIKTIEDALHHASSGTLPLSADWQTYLLRVIETIRTSYPEGTRALELS